MKRTLQSFLLCAAAATGLCSGQAVAQSAGGHEHALRMRDAFEQATADLRIATQAPAATFALHEPAVPDLRTGYAPYRPAFIAHFEPAVVPSLDPQERIQSAFVPRDLAAQIDDLSTLGFAPTLAGARATRVLYVTREHDGLLAGIAYSPEANDMRYRKMYQAVVAHENVVADDVLRIGGSLTFARGRRELDRGDHYAVNLGSTFTVNEELMFGVGATLDRRSVLGHFAAAADPDARRRSRAWGAVASVTFNRGAWAAGAYHQRARTIEKAFDGQMDRLAATEIGVSYLLRPRTRLYSAYYRYDFQIENRLLQDAADGVWLLGIRAAL